jgi:hypothetical protein
MKVWHVQNPLHPGQASESEREPGSHRAVETICYSEKSAARRPSPSPFRACFLQVDRPQPVNSNKRHLAEVERIHRNTSSPIDFAAATASCDDMTKLSCGSKTIPFVAAA